jgi:hypothetical protein
MCNLSTGRDDAKQYVTKRKEQGSAMPAFGFRAKHQIRIDMNWTVSHACSRLLLLVVLQLVFGRQGECFHDSSYVPQATPNAGLAISQMKTTSGSTTVRQVRATHLWVQEFLLLFDSWRHLCCLGSPTDSFEGSGVSGMKAHVIHNCEQAEYTTTLWCGSRFAGTALS